MGVHRSQNWMGRSNLMIEIISNVWKKKNNNRGGMGGKLGKHHTILVYMWEARSLVPICFPSASTSAIGGKTFVPSRTFPPRPPSWPWDESSSSLPWIKLWCSSSSCCWWWWWCSSPRECCCSSSPTTWWCVKWCSSPLCPESPPLRAKLFCVATSISIGLANGFEGPMFFLVR